MSPLADHSFKSSSTYLKCENCGDRHSYRWRRPGWCLACDLIDRGQQGESVQQIAERMQLPPFLIGEFLAR